MKLIFERYLSHHQDGRNISPNKASLNIFVLGIITYRSVIIYQVQLINILPDNDGRSISSNVALLTTLVNGANTLGK